MVNVSLVLVPEQFTHDNGVFGSGNAGSCDHRRTVDWDEVCGELVGDGVVLVSPSTGGRSHLHVALSGWRVNELDGTNQALVSFAILREVTEGASTGLLIHLHLLFDPSFRLVIGNRIGLRINRGELKIAPVPLVALASTAGIGLVAKIEERGL